MVRNLGTQVTASDNAADGVPVPVLCKLGDTPRVPFADVSANTNVGRRGSSDGFVQLRDTALGGKAGFLTKGKDGEWTAAVPESRQSSRTTDAQRTESRGSESIEATIRRASALQPRRVPGAKPEVNDALAEISESMAELAALLQESPIAPGKDDKGRDRDRAQSFYTGADPTRQSPPRYYTEPEAASGKTSAAPRTSLEIPSAFRSHQAGSNAAADPPIRKHGGSVSSGIGAGGDAAPAAPAAADAADQSAPGCGLSPSESGAGRGAAAAHSPQRAPEGGSGARGGPSTPAVQAALAGLTAVLREAAELGGDESPLPPCIQIEEARLDRVVPDLSGSANKPPAPPRAPPARSPAGCTTCDLSESVSVLDASAARSLGLELGAPGASASSREEDSLLFADAREPSPPGSARPPKARRSGGLLCDAAAAAPGPWSHSQGAEHARVMCDQSAAPEQLSVDDGAINVTVSDVSDCGQDTCELSRNGSKGSPTPRRSSPPGKHRPVTPGRRATPRRLHTLAFANAAAERDAERDAERAVERAAPPAPPAAPREEAGGAAGLGVKFKKPAGGGLPVAGVVTGGPAHGAGIRVGDVLQYCSVATGVLSPETRPREVAALLAGAGAAFRLVVQRGGETLGLTVERGAGGGGAPLGLEVSKEEKRNASVRAVRPGSPAWVAGLRAGDVLVAVGAAAVGDASLSRAQLVGLLSGPHGSQAALGFSRGGGAAAAPPGAGDGLSWVLVRRRAGVPLGVHEPQQIEPKRPPNGSKGGAGGWRVVPPRPAAAPAAPAAEADAPADAAAAPGVPRAWLEASCVAAARAPSGGSDAASCSGSTSARSSASARSARSARSVRSSMSALAISAAPRLSLAPGGALSARASLATMPLPAPRAREIAHLDGAHLVAAAERYLSVCDARRASCAAALGGGALARPRAAELDARSVAQRTGATEARARRALEGSGGDVVDAIMAIRQGRF